MSSSLQNARIDTSFPNVPIGVSDRSRQCANRASSQVRCADGQNGFWHDELARLLAGRGALVVLSVRIGKSIRKFNISSAQRRALALSTANLGGGLSLVNIFAPWCIIWPDARPVSIDLKRTGAGLIDGMNNEYQFRGAEGWVNAMGASYLLSGANLTPPIDELSVGELPCG